LKIAVKVLVGQRGEVVHSLSHLPDALPPVTRRDLEMAWEAAHAGAETSAPPRAFRFAQPEAAPVQLVLNDPDAAAWALAVDGIADLATAHGVSLCLRLLALVALMARAEWMRPWFALDRSGLNFDPALLQAAAISPLSRSGDFDETALRALLPQRVAQG